MAPKSLALRPRMLRKFLSGAIFLAGLVLWENVQAQEKTLRQSLRFDHLSSEHGLSGSGIACIFQDSQGFMWFGTTDGLNRFDGYQFKIYIHDPRDPESLSENSVTSIYESRDGNLWFGTNGGGLNRFDPSSERFVHFKQDPDNPHSLSHNEVRSIQEDRDGNLWIGTADGLAMLEHADSKRFVPYRHEPEDASSLSHDSILTIFKDRTGILWIGTDGGGVNKLHPDSPGRFVHYRHDRGSRDSLSHDQVWAIHQDRSGIIWIGTANGLNRLDPISRHMRRFLPGPSQSHHLSDDDIRAIWEDRSGNLWIGTRKGGVNRLNPERSHLEAYLPDRSDPHSLSYHHVNSIYEDRGGVLWFGTRENGLNKLNPTGMSFGHYRFFDREAGSLPFDVMSILEDKRGMLWVGTPTGLLHFDRNKTLVNHYGQDPDRADSLSNSRVWTIYEDRQDVLWVGTDQGLNRLDRDESEKGEASFSSYKAAPGDPHGLSHDVVISMLEDQNGAFWVGTAGGGLNQLNRDTGHFVTFHYEEDNPFSLSNDTVTSILEDRSGSMWIGTYDGLNKRDPANPQRFIAYRPDRTNPRSLSHQRVLAIHESSAGELWVGADGGLNKFDPSANGFVQYWKKDGLPNDVVYGILEDSHGFLWISTNGGLARLDPVREIFKNYDSGDGLQKNEFQFGAFFQAADGKLFFGGENGLNAFYPDRIQENLIPPPVVITSFLLFHEPAFQETTAAWSQPERQAAEVRLSYTDKVFSFEFAALDYANPQKNRYAYMLDGTDQGWQLTDASRRFITYSRLDPGSYVFRVKASNKDGVWNEQGVAVPVVILPPPWRTWWAYSLYGVLAVSCLSGYLWSHRKKLAYERSINERLDQKVTERTRALEQKNRENLEKQQILSVQATKLAQQTNQLRQMDELKTRFFTNISHDIRTPLTLALGPLEDIFSENLVTGEPRAKLELVWRNTCQLKKLIDELLDFSKLEAGHMTVRARREDVIAFLRKWAHAFSPSAQRKGITLTFKTDCEAVPLYFDPDKLERVCFNLLSNSIKFTPEGGKILVQAHDRDPGFLEISVKDTGPGIPADQLPYVFDRFYQAENPAGGLGSGSGIGLSLARELVLLQGGDIHINSEPGLGCEFMVRLPKGKAHLEPDQLVAPDTVREETEAVLPSRALSKERAAGEPESGHGLQSHTHTDTPSVLVVEDHADLRRYICEHLASTYDVLEAENGEIGLDLALDRVPDLVLSDVMMPDMDGFALCRKLKTDEKTSHIPVVLLTAKTATQSNIAGLELGADDYIVKPFPIPVLMTRIRNLIDTRRKLRERFSKEMILQPSRIPITSSDQAFLQKALDVVECHMGDSQFGVYELAEELGFSRRQLHRKLTALTDKTPGDFLRQIRLERAAQLLKERAGNVAEVAYAVGFNKPQYFSTLFRAAFGKNPAEYAS